MDGSWLGVILTGCFYFIIVRRHMEVHYHLAGFFQGNSGLLLGVFSSELTVKDLRSANFNAWE